MSSCQSDPSRPSIAWQWYAAAICFILSILLHFINLSQFHVLQSWLDFADGLLFGLTFGLILIALVGSRKRC